MIYQAGYIFEFGSQSPWIPGIDPTRPSALRSASAWPPRSRCSCCDAAAAPANENNVLKRRRPGPRPTLCDGKNMNSSVPSIYAPGPATPPSPPPPWDGSHILAPYEIFPLPPLWCGGGVALSPSPPCGVVGVWYGMLGMYGVYGRSGMACLESMVCLVCMVGMVCKSVGYGMFDMTVCMVCMVCMVTMMGMEYFLCKVGVVCMACMFAIVCMVGVRRCGNYISYVWYVWYV